MGLPYLAKERFGGGPAEFGLMLSMFGLGALAGALLAGSLRHVPRLGLVVLLIAGGLGVGVALVGNAPSLWIVDGAILLIGLGAGFVNVRVIAWLQARTDEAFRGRVMSLVMLGGVGLAPFSLAIAGFDHRPWRGHAALLGGRRHRGRRRAGRLLLRRAGPDDR